jgi:hypothetical protein
MSTINNIRQRLQPREFRIEAFDLPDDLFDTLKKIAQYEPPAAAPDPDAEHRSRFLADMATGVWRLRQKMLDPGTQRPKEQFRREYRHLESIWDVLTQAGVEIQDHTGQLFDAGQAIKVLERVPTPNVKRERVHETVKPTIYYKGKQIQMGEVFVETPMDSATTPPNNS